MSLGTKFLKLMQPETGFIYYKIVASLDEGIISLFKCTVCTSALLAIRIREPCTHAVLINVEHAID